MPSSGRNFAGELTLLFVLDAAVRGAGFGLEKWETIVGGWRINLANIEDDCVAAAAACEAIREYREWRATLAPELERVIADRNVIARARLEGRELRRSRRAPYIGTAKMFAGYEDEWGRANTSRCLMVGEWLCSRRRGL
jgi:hypothetical protein